MKRVGDLFTFRIQVNKVHAVCFRILHDLKLRGRRQEVLPLVMPGPPGGPVSGIQLQFPQDFTIIQAQAAAGLPSDRLS